MNITLGWVARQLLGRGEGAWAGQPVSRGIVDSREAAGGDLFFAFAGEVVDGQDYLADAIRGGAAAAVARREGQFAVDGPVPLEGGWVLPVPDVLQALQGLAQTWRAQQQATVVAVTGSVGKTLTRGVVAAVLAQRGAVLESQRNYNNEIGLPLTLLQLREEHAFAVVEMGMYALGEISALAAIARPSVAVVTNVGPTHLERLGSIDNIAQAKGELVRSLDAGGLAVLNSDDPRVLAMAETSPCRVVTYGTEPGTDYRAINVRSERIDGIEFDLAHGGQVESFAAPLPGRHSVYACLAAVAVGLESGLSWAQVREGLASTSGASRMRVLRVGGLTVLDDSYNAAPASVLAALEVLERAGGRRVAVLGDMLELGAASAPGHAEVGAAAAERSDVVIAVGPLAQGIASAAEGSPGCGRVLALGSVEEALVLVPELLEAGDTVLVKGSRGMRLERLVQVLERQFCAD